MNSKHLLLPALLVLPLLCGSAAAQTVRQMFVFGDSYSAYAGDSIEKDGPTSIVYAARSLGLTIVPSTGEFITGTSLNFAMGGATTGTDHVGGPAKPKIGMKNQVALFADLLRNKRLQFDPKKTMFFLEGGLNDRKLTTEETVANLKSEILSLHALGAKNFRVAVLPTRIPRFTDVAERLNPSLKLIPETMRTQLPDIFIKNSNWGEFYDEVFDHAKALGFTDTIHPCYEAEKNNQPASVCSTPQTYFFYPANHPSTRVHQIVGEKLYRELQ